VEKAENSEEHRDGVLESLSPEGHLETVLAERVALLTTKRRHFSVAGSVLLVTFTAAGAGPW
jgi:hypothetical protein